MGLGRGRWPGLVDKRNQNVGRMSPDMPLHPTALTHYFEHLIPTHRGKHRHVGLQQ